jgi:hypothetical protein
VDSIGPEFIPQLVAILVQQTTVQKGSTRAIPSTTELATVALFGCCSSKRVPTEVPYQDAITFTGEIDVHHLAFSCKHPLWDKFAVEIRRIGLYTWFRPLSNTFALI